MDPTREPQVARKSAAAKRPAGEFVASLTQFIKHRLKLQSKRSCPPHRIRPLSLMGRTNPTDNLSMLRPESLAHSLHVRRIVGVIEGDGVYRGRNPRGEPQLGRGLYATIRGRRAGSYDQMPLLWVLNLLDGRRAGIPFATFSAILMVVG